jgi:phosphatidylglycerol:prolipoprotein diacylglycerol transferase
VEWLDICMPAVLVGQAVGRWGNFFNQEAYGRPTDLGFGVKIAAEHRLPPYNDMVAYPPDQLFHATFLYESLWNIVGFGLILLIERRLRPRLRTGDSALFYAIWYGIGRFWVEGLRTDSLCTNGIGGECADALRTAQIASVLLIVVGVVGLVINHMRRLPPPAPTAADEQDPAPEPPAELPAPSEGVAPAAVEVEPGGLTPAHEGPPERS